MRIDAAVTFLGNAFLRYGKGALPVVILAAYSLAVPDEAIFGSEQIEHVLDLAALALVLLGLTFRALAVGAVGGPDPSRLVEGGPYALSRNPRYLGSLLVCFGIFLMHGSPHVVIVGTVACLLIYVAMVRVEEDELSARYGERYRAYCAAVPRWLPDISRLEPGSARHRFQRAPRAGRRLADDRGDRLRAGVHRGA